MRKPIECISDATISIVPSLYLFHMTKQQFKRLTIVLLLPLLALGAWLGAKDVLWDSRFTTLCTEHAEFFVCSSTEGVSEARALSDLEGSVLRFGSARLPGGLRHDVTITEQLAARVVDGEEKMVNVAEDGIKRRLVAPTGILGDRQTGQHCSIDKHYTKEGRWWVTCNGGATLMFAFDNPKDAKKFDDLVEIERAESMRVSTAGSVRRAVATVLPLAAYFALALGCWILIRLARYVRGPAVTG
ncbi:hypothetical protein [Hydrogenophaga sp.]|uniref:hypothetical protein n=1 Tax=Hydrogenophaga sp. TaxID=1904254 RepID=UPI00262C7F33|nr:hypothetical protein [Hydrogenophaga sp.]